MKKYDRATGARVLVTRQFEQSGTFINGLSQKGYYPFILPMIETVQLCPYIAEDSYDVILFTSANAVKYFAPYKNLALGKAYIAVGPKTAEAMEVFLGISSHITPVVFDMEHALEIIYKLNLRGAKILSPGAVKRMELPVDDLESRGAKVFTPAVYETYFAEYPKDYIDDFIAVNKINVITFCSPSAVKSFVKQFKGSYSNLDIISIGETTYKELKKYNIENRYPENYTVEGMIDII